MNLTQPYQHQQHIVYTDNYFTSVPLFKRLTEVEIHAIGTVQARRVPQASASMMESGELHRGNWRCRSGDGVLCTMWQDRGPVYFLSTYCDYEQQGTIMRRFKSHSTPMLPIGCPQCGILYNQYMRGVDVLSQLQSYYSIGTRVHKWWHRPFWWLLDIAIINSYILYKEHCQNSNQKAITHKQYRIQLMTELRNDYTGNKHSGRPKKRGRQDSTVHTPIKASTERTCKQCQRRLSSRKHSTQTRWMCEQCHIHLCIDGCFKEHVFDAERSASSIDDANE